jgi:hypothetical protein
MRSAVDKVFWLQPVKVRSEELSVCLGSYLSGGHGDVTVDASGTEVSHSERLATVRAATRVKPEQAPKGLTWRSSRPYNGEDHWRTVWTTESAVRIHRGMGRSMHRSTRTQPREICRGAPARRNGSIRSRPKQKSEELIVAMKPGNAGRAKGLWFGVRLNGLNERGSA